MTWQTVATAATSTIFNTDNLCCEIALDKPKEHLNFNVPPLALVIAMIERNKSLSDIIETLHGAGSTDVDMPERVVTAEHLIQADQIYRYFASKFTMRRLKNEYISSWMEKVDAFCNERNRIDKESLTVLVTLPKFYKENRELEPLMRDYSGVSVKTGKDVLIENFAETLTFIKKIERRAKRVFYNDYYWKTQNNKLVRIRLENNTAGVGAWDCLGKLGKIKITSDYCYVQRIQGYDFYVLQPHSVNMEINIA